MVLKLMKILYRLNDTSLTWFEHLTEGLETVVFKANPSDPCIFTRGTYIIIFYVDGCIIISNTKEEVDAIFEEIISK